MGKTTFHAAAPPLFSTRQLAVAAGVTPRTVRFYESRGLLQAQRAGAVRVFTATDRTRLNLILRAKRLGFTLHDIGEVLDLYRADPARREHLPAVAARTRARIAELESKLADVQATLRELRRIEHAALRRLKTGAAAQTGRRK